MNLKYFYNNARASSTNKRFKCMICGDRFGEYNQLVKHTLKYHKDDINGEDIDRFLYELRNPGPYICTICKKRPRVWDPVNKKYKMLCDSPECKTAYRKRFQRNMIRKYGTDNLLNDPERQVIMLQNRKITRKYKFKDGVEIDCVGNYEYDFIKFCETKLELTSADIQDAPKETFLQYYNPQDKKNHTYIPDFYMPEYNLVIEIKDGSKYPIDSKYKSELKAQAVVKNNKYNYIKIVDENYTDFVNLLNSLKDYNITESNQTQHTFIIPKSKFDLL